MTRETKETICPGCNHKQERRIRKDSTRVNHFCNTCKQDKLFSAFRQAKYKFPQLNFNDYKKLKSINNCEICNVKLTDGGGPGTSGATNRQIDHCHETNVIRGVLCWNCNSAIGKLGDTAALVMRAVDYLKQKES